MPQSRPLQSEPQFNAFMAGFDGLSYSVANLLMQYTTALLIQLSQVHLAVKLAESLVTGKVMNDFLVRVVAGKLDERLNNFYQGYASQLTMGMLHHQPSSANVDLLRKGNAALNDNVGKLVAKNAELTKDIKNQLGPDAASKDNKNDDYTPPKKRY